MTLNESTNLLQLDPADLLIYLRDNIQITIPHSVETLDDMKAAGELLGQYTSYYIYFIQMTLHANICKRMSKKGNDKEAAENCLIKEQILSKYSEMSKTAYAAISRMITIKQQINQELRMTDGGLSHPYGEAYREGQYASSKK